jgi:hypothetical protein
MFAVPAMTAAESAVTIQDLELEHAELLPARETLLVPHLYPKGPVHFTGGPVAPVGDPGHMVGTPVYARGD